MTGGMLEQFAAAQVGDFLPCFLNVTNINESSQLTKQSCASRPDPKTKTKTLRASDRETEREKKIEAVVEWTWDRCLRVP